MAFTIKIGLNDWTIAYVDGDKVDKNCWCYCDQKHIDIAIDTPLETRYRALIHEIGHAVISETGHWKSGTEGDSSYTNEEVARIAEMIGEVIVKNNITPQRENTWYSIAIKPDKYKHYGTHELNQIIDARLAAREIFFHYHDTRINPNACSADGTVKATTRTPCKWDPEYDEFDVDSIESMIGTYLGERNIDARKIVVRKSGDKMMIVDWEGKLIEEETKKEGGEANAAKNN